MKKFFKKVGTWISEHVNHILMGILFVLGAIVGWILGKEDGTLKGMHEGAEACDDIWWRRGTNDAGEVPQRFEVIHNPKTSVTLKDLFHRETDWTDEQIDDYCGDRKIIGIGVYTDSRDDE